MPRTGPCSPWINGQDVRSMLLVQKVLAESKRTQQPIDGERVDAICAMAAAVASEALYRMSGKVLTGDCGPVTCRPVSRPTYLDGNALWGGGAFGYISSWGSCLAGMGSSRTALHFGCSTPPEILLPDYPVTKIQQVKIDGVIIPPDEYELRDYKWLVRIRPTVDSTPTERWGWPTCQTQDLPDSEVGTFSVTYFYGQDPGEGGRLAARKLAEYIALPELGDSTHYPQRVTSIHRQGVQATVTDVMDVIKSKSLGIWEVDSWLLSVNPNKLQAQARVFSPDRGRGRRQGRPTR